MKSYGLFAGIGGFELGLADSGHQAIGLCEILPAAQAVLRSALPDVPIHSDITTLDRLPQNAELVCAGFPCQDLSQAGPTHGLTGSKSSLVYDVFRLLEVSRPPWVIIENVPFMLQLHQGSAMREITAKMETLGYRWAYRVVDTYSFGLPQRRERVFLVASNVADPSSVILTDDNPLQRPLTALRSIAHGFYWTEGRGGLGWAPDAVPTLKNGSTIGIPSPPALLLSDGRIAKPDLRDTERLQGFPADWTKPAESVGRSSSRWGLVGSAVSVPVASWLGARLTQDGIYDSSRDRPFPLSGKLPKAARFDGTQRFAVQISTDPVGLGPPHLETFLRFGPEPLSVKATSGFLSRTRVATLRFAEGFIEAVERYLEDARRREATLPRGLKRSTETASVPGA